MNCPHCGYDNREGVRFCANCGNELAPPWAISSPNPSMLSQPPKYAYPPTYARPIKDRSVAYILEILPGLFGILGIGWFYAGNTNAGIAWLVITLAWDVLAVIIDVATVGFGCFCSVPVNIVLITVSTIALSGYIKQHPELFG